MQMFIYGAGGHAKIVYDAIENCTNKDINKDDSFLIREMVVNNHSLNILIDNILKFTS